ncbi:translocation/assembly module TamB domain-containing protein [Pseudohoeflea coraliihabitans]|uniref:Translocation/assembly module TamB domain-containing protein n=1 Tax=Pseudohoeflea coraliihabitans TaxID=2860393 RepID=A0ABS6WV26_9HYPH|nr:translocation/assembly module TamB domain-containing protein [Pseudohoeflea sp. DP4N28-3]MBW3098895.1 translocation/assembly module TamB domain-containing protein [Pseudohoeflea sp. DP4N28-3]
MSDAAPPAAGHSLLRRVMIGTLALVILLVAAVIFLFATVPGGRVVALIVNRLGSSAIQSVEVDSITGLVSGQTRLGHLTIADADGDPWLLLRGIELDWAPFAIFSAGLDIERLHIDEVEILRRPDAVADNSDPTGGALTLPLNIDIATLDLPDVLLGKALAGSEARLSAAGALRLNQDLSDVVVDLDVDRIDGVGGAAIIKANVNLPEQRFDLDATLSEPSGGVMAHMLGLSPDDAVALKARSRGALDDWQLDLTGEINGAQAASGTAAVTASEAGHAFEASLRGQVGRFLPPQLAQLFEGDSDLVASGLLEPDNAGVQLDLFTLRSASLMAEGQGRLSRQGNSDFRASITGRDAQAGGTVELVVGQDDGRIALFLDSLELTVAGAADNAEIVLAAAVPRLESSDISAENVALSAQLRNVDLAAGTGGGQLQLTAGSAGAADATLARALAGALRVEGGVALNGDELTLEALAVSSATADLIIDASFNRAESTGRGHIEGQLNTAVLTAGLPETLGPQLKLAGDFTLPGDNAVTLSDLTLATDRLSVAGGAALDAQRNVTADLTATIAQLSDFTEAASGRLELSTTLEGALLSPQFEATLTGDDLLIQGEPIEDLRLLANGGFEAGAPAADIELTAAFRGAPLTGTARIMRRGEATEIDELQLVVAENSLSGAFSLDAAQRPTGQASLDLPAIGALAALAGVELSGEGKGVIALELVGETPMLTADLSVSTLAGEGFALSGAAAEIKISDYLAAPQLRGTLTAGEIDAAGTAITGAAVDLSLEEGGWTRFEGAATAAALPVSLSGRLRQADGATELQLDAASLVYKALPVTLEGPARLSVRDGVATIDTLRLSPGAGSLAVSGTAGADALDLDVALDGVRLASLEPLVPELGYTGALNGAVRITGSPAKPQISPALVLDDLAAAPGQAPLSPVLARAAAGGLRLAGDLQLDGSALQIDVLRLVSDTLSAEISGGLDIPDLTGQARLDATADTDVFASGFGTSLGETMRVAADIVLPGGNAVTLDDLSISSAELTASGSATLDAERNITAELTAELADVSTLNPLATGSVNASAAIAGTLAAPEFSLTVAGRDITIDGEPIEALRVAATGGLDDATPRADVEISGTFRGKPITGTAQLTSRDGVNRIEPLRLQLDDNRIEGALRLDEAFRPTGTVDLDLPDLGALAALAGIDITGSGTGALELSIDNDVPVLAADLSIASLVGNGFSLDNARVDARIRDYLTAPAVTGTVNVAALNAGETAVSDVDVDVSLEEGWTRFDATADADGLPLEVAGRVRAEDGETRLELDTARIIYQGLPVALSGPSGLNIRDGMAEIETLTFSPGGGTVTVSGSAGADALDLDVRLDGLPLGTIDRFAPGTGLAGTVSGTVDVTGSPSAPRARFDLSANSVRANALAGFSSNPLSVSANGLYDGNSVSFDATARDPSGLVLNADGQVGLTGARTLSINASGSAPFSLLAAQLAAQGLVLEGSASLDMRVGGTLASPDFAGTIRTADGRFIDTRSGIAINDLAADIGLDRQSVNIRSLTGTLSSGGRLTGSGRIGLNAAEGFPADLAVKVAEGRYADGKLVATRFDADLTVTGPLTRLPTLGGTINLGRTTITVPTGLPGSIAHLDVAHRNADADVRRQEARINSADSDGAQGGIALDLRLNAPNRIFVRGRGIDAEFGGSLRLRGTTADPIAIGGFDLVRGRLDILGQRLDFDSGRIGFTGAMIPSLDFAATTRSGTATVTILISGPATRPEFDFTSSPDMPDDEVLAQLVFGRSLTDLSPFQIAQLAAAAAELTGVASGGGLVGSLRKATGIDNLDIKADEDTGEATVAVGKYLNDRTYLGIEQGASAGSGKATIDLEIGRGLKLRGSASSSGETKGGIFFERDY